MNEISSDDLKKKIDKKNDFKLVFCLAKNRFLSKHIPGSICIPLTQESNKDRLALKEDIQQLLGIDDEIIVYCSDVGCSASVLMYQRLEQLGYKNISRFSGGLKKWEEDGHACIGEMVI